MQSLGSLNFLFLLCSLYIACGESPTGGLSGKNTAISSLHQVAVITDETLLESPVLDTLDYYYASAYPLLPRPEPYFDLRLFTIQQLFAEKTRRELKVYLVLVDISKDTEELKNMITSDLGQSVLENEEGIKIVQEKWAYNQIVIYVYAQDEERLISLVKDSYIALNERITDFYIDQVDANAYVSGKDLGMHQRVLDHLNIDMDFPKGFKVALEDKDFMWVRRDMDKSIENIIIHRLPYTSEEQLSYENVKHILDALGKKYISSSAEGSYKRINDIDLPLILNQQYIQNSYAIQARGIWEMENDYMGGPLTAYIVLDEKNNQLIVLEGFVFAPGEKKRNKMIILDHILRSLSL